MQGVVRVIDLTKQKAKKKKGSLAIDPFWLK